MLDFFRKKEKTTPCPICGSSVVNGFCNTCKKYISDEIANEELSKKYPNTKCPHCKSKKIQFQTDIISEACPRNFIDTFALKLISKYDNKYPQSKPDFHETAKCQKCGYVWFLDNYKDDNARMKKVSLGIIIVSIILLLTIVITIGSISESISDDFSDDNNYVNSYEELTEETTTTTTTETNTTISEETTASEITEANTESVTKAVGKTVEENIEKPVVETEKETAADIEESTTEKKSGITVYITPTGEKYHYSASCAGKNAKARDLDDVKGIWEPCKKCS